MFFIIKTTSSSGGDESNKGLWIMMEITTGKRYIDGS